MEYERVEPPQLEDVPKGELDSRACTLFKDEVKDVYYSLCVDGFINLYRWRIRLYCICSGRSGELRESTTKYRIKTKKPCKVSDHLLSQGEEAKKVWNEASEAIDSATEKKEPK